MKWYSYLIILVLLIIISLAYINKEKPTEIGVTDIDSYRIGQNIITNNIETSDYIILSKNEWKTTLVKDGNNWYVQKLTGRKLPAAEGRVSSLFEQLKDIQVERISSINPANFEIFLVDETSAFNLIFKSDGNDILHFLIGKNNESFTGTYVRSQNETTTLLTNVRIGSNIVNAREEFWINKEILGDVEINNITSIKLNYYEDKNIVKIIERDITTDSFYLVYSDTRFEISRDKVKAVTDTLKYLKGTDFAPETVIAEEAFEMVNYECEINFLTGPSYRIIVGNKITEEDYFIKNPVKDYIYSIPEITLQRIFQPLKFFKD